MEIPYQDVRIYTAGKTWSAEKFRELRDLYGFNVIARWIDVQDVLTSPTDVFPPELLTDEAYKREIWEHGCKVDCLRADMALVAATPEDKDMHSGSLVEMGHVSLYKPVYVHGTCESFEPVGHSDRAWKSQRNFHIIPDEFETLREGATWAVDHYRLNYRQRHEFNRRLNDIILASRELDAPDASLFGAF